MKALVFYEHGGLDKLQIADIPTPPVPSDYVLVDVKAAALNRLDWWVREGWAGLKLPMPHVLGADGAGVIAALGDHVKDFKAGQRVTINPSVSCGNCEFCWRGDDQMCRSFRLIGETTGGTFAEQIAVPARNLMVMPDDFPFEEAAAANLVMVTAWNSLIRQGGLRAGEDVLIVGAGGGVNTASIQIAKHAGARVFVVASDATKAAKAKALGADIVIDRSKEDWGKAVFQLTNRRGVDVVVDNVGQATWMMSIRSLARGGRMLVVGNTSGYTIQMDSRFIFSKHIRIIGSTMGSQQDFRDVMKLVFQRKIKIPVDSVLPLSEAIEAQRRLQDGDVFGKIVVKP
jgi:NADPH:quinone reductase-like Zn-dependent oxidoreductase